MSSAGPHPLGQSVECYAVFMTEWYPYLIVVGGIFLLSLYAMWERNTGDSRNSVDPGDRLIAVCVIAAIMAVGFIFVGMLHLAEVNSTNKRIATEQKLAGCRTMEEPGQRTLCLMQVGTK